MKRALAITVAAAILISVCQFGVFAADFPDVPADHWAYTYVDTLVNDGTVKGYDDGEFKPNNTVTRAEFVKMLGKGPAMRARAFDDVPADYWGFDYIMFSGLEGTGNSFFPEVPITRNDVMELIWKRNGAVADAPTAPTSVLVQSKNRQAVSWAYMNGLIIGDDGVNLRLDETLTRAEGSAMIVRARAINADTPKTNFIDKVSPEVLKHVFESAKIFDEKKTYDPEATLTYGEVALASLHIGSEETNLTYSKFNNKPTFEHKYAKPLHAMCVTCLSEEKDSINVVDKPATVQDAMTMLIYGALLKTTAPPVYKARGTFPKDVTSVDNKNMDICMSVALDYGIQFSADGSIGASQPITHKKFAAILLQVDSLIGFETTTLPNGVTGKIGRVDSSLQTNINRLPFNKDKFQCILKDIPTKVYEAPFTNLVERKLSNVIVGSPVDTYDFSREFRAIFDGMLVTMDSMIESSLKMKIQFSYYPTLVWDNGVGYTVRTKVEIVDVDEKYILDDVFPLDSSVDGSIEMTNGKTFFVDIDTGDLVSGAVNLSKMRVIQAIEL